MPAGRGYLFSEKISATLSIQGEITDMCWIMDAENASEFAAVKGFESAKSVFRQGPGAAFE